MCEMLIKRRVTHTHTHDAGDASGDKRHMRKNKKEKGILETGRVNEHFFNCTFGVSLHTHTHMGNIIIVPRRYNKYVNSFPAQRVRSSQR